MTPVIDLQYAKKPLQLFSLVKVFLKANHFLRSKKSYQTDTQLHLLEIIRLDTYKNTQY